jgi:quinol-cytochrome oxidoreductase complex cytochrome b subunit
MSEGNGGPGKEPDRFYPAAMFDTVVTALLVTAVVIGLAIVFRVEVGIPADPTDTSVVPRPEWYFANVFQMLKFFPGSLEVIGTVVLPTLGLIAVAAIPFLDRSPERKASRRKKAMIGAGLVVVLMLVLMVLGLTT